MRPVPCSVPAILAQIDAGFARAQPDGAATPAAFRGRPRSGAGRRAGQYHEGWRLGRSKQAPPGGAFPNNFLAGRSRQMLAFLGHAIGDRRLSPRVIHDIADVFRRFVRLRRLAAVLMRTSGAPTATNRSPTSAPSQRMSHRRAWESRPVSPVGHDRGDDVVFADRIADL